MTTIVELRPSFAAVSGDPTWEPPRRPSRGNEKWPLPKAVVAEGNAFRDTLIRQGRACRGTALIYRKAMLCAAKQGQRVLGRRLTSLWEMYDVPLLAAITVDDVPFDDLCEQLAQYTLRQRRVALRAFVRAMVHSQPAGSERTFADLNGVLDEGFRLPSRRRGNRYTVPAGRPPGRHRTPTPAEVDAVVAQAGRAKHRFIGLRNQLVIEIARETGLRSVSVLGLEADDVRVARGRGWLHVREKGCEGKRPVAISARLLAKIFGFCEAFNDFSQVQGSSRRLRLGAPGPLWLGTGGRPLGYAGLLTMVRSAAKAAGVEDFHFHGLRHLRSVELGSALAADDAAHALGDTEGVFLRYYAEAGSDFRLVNPVPQPLGLMDGFWPVTARESYEETASAEAAAG
jgi:integrase